MTFVSVKNTLIIPNAWPMTTFYQVIVWQEKRLTISCIIFSSTWKELGFLGLKFKIIKLQKRVLRIRTDSLDDVTKREVKLY